MAPSFANFSALISLAFLFIFIAAPLSTAEKHSKLKTICSKTSNHHLCMKLLKSESRSGYESNREITKIAIDLAYNKARDMNREFNSLSDGAGDSTPRDRYRSCSKNYNDAARDLEQTRRLFDYRDYSRITVQVNDAVEEIRDCKNQLESSDSSSHIKKGNKEFELLCNVVRIASEYLRDEHDSD